MAFRRSQKITCPTCSSKTDRDAKFCGSCGAELPQTAFAESPGDPEPPQGSRKGLFVRIGIGAAIFFVLAGAGVGVYLKIQHDNEVEREQAIAAEQAADRKAALDEYNACKRDAGELVDKLTGVNARLDVGMTYDEYTDFVADVNVEYERQTTADLGVDCLSAVAVPAEEAVNEYVRAARRWDDCIDDLDCDVDNLDLQSYWTRAGESADEAAYGLARLQP